MSPDSNATLEVRINDANKDTEQLTSRMNAEFKNIWDTIDKLRDRPPAWCTAIIALLSGALSAVSTSLLQHILK